ncbi:putative regulatory protein [Mycobacteroides abscessus subsp. bolletii]|uniref:sigma 54 modulation/S30EA ribosomal C-terminal domain-containing protein n=1 Tax=Mycobacteroides abscessus TaxID=36809 RepID=UPI0009CBE7C7|nr:sigma 54 modulation/S30EA ribosomal C-terminal domain-containing protein [Mycobacteroides abscessus]SKY83021.1 putative regulatory protein [Mycobacteroides abscessus subsp. bolletii]
MQLPLPDAGDLSPLISRLWRQIAAGPRRWPDPERLPLTAAADAVITRRKAVALQAITVREAITVLDAMNFEAYLFIDAETGEDALVYRAGPTGLRLARQRRVHPPGGIGTDTASAASVVVTPRQTPVLPQAQAAARVRMHGLPYLFYTDLASGRGQLLYTRYDGHVALLTLQDPGGRSGGTA